MNKIISNPDKAETWLKSLIVLVFALIYGFGTALIFDSAQCNSSAPAHGIATVIFLGIIPITVGTLSIFAIPSTQRTAKLSLVVATAVTLTIIASSVLIASGGIFGVGICLLVVSRVLVVPVIITILVLETLHLARQHQLRD